MFNQKPIILIRNQCIRFCSFSPLYSFKKFMPDFVMYTLSISLSSNTTIFKSIKPRLHSPGSVSLKSSILQIFLSVCDSSIFLAFCKWLSIFFVRGLPLYCRCSNSLFMIRKFLGYRGAKSKKWAGKIK